jgi:hypothetical protein
MKILNTKRMNKLSNKQGQVTLEWMLLLVVGVGLALMAVRGLVKAHIYRYTYTATNQFSQDQYRDESSWNYPNLSASDITTDYFEAHPWYIKEILVDNYRPDQEKHDY